MLSRIIVHKWETIPSISNYLLRLLYLLYSMSSQNASTYKLSSTLAAYAL